MVIHIPNWKNFNARADRANYTWFRMQNEFFHDQKIFGLTDAQKLLYLAIICQSSKKNSSTVELDSKYLSAMLGHAVQSIINNLDHLHLIKIIEIKQRDVSLAPNGVKPPPNGSPTDRQTIQTDKQTQIHTVDSEKKISPNKSNGKNNDVLLPAEAVHKHWDDELFLLRHWNKLGLAQHQENVSTMRKIKTAIAARKKKKTWVGLGPMATAMENYAQSVLGPGWFSYRWSIWDFIRREGSEKFYPDNFIPDNFTNKTKGRMAVDQTKSLLQNNPFRKDK